MHDAEKSRPKDEAIDSEATSKDTVTDIEQNEESSDDIPSEDSAGESKSPAPDGSFDDSHQIKGEELM